jgi:dihydroorotate dehydrogenase (NAD+) catalytic subunit
MSVEVDLTTDVAGVLLPNPVMTAAGCAGTGRELSPYVDVAALGAVVTRSVTLDPRAGAPAPRLLETPGGVLSATGLQNPGLQGFLATELPWLAQRRARAVVSVAGSTLAEYAELARRVGASPGVTAVEVNLSLPNPENRGRPFGAEPYQAAKVLGVVRRELPRGVPALAKLRADPGSVADAAAAVAKAGADGVVVGDGPTGMARDPHTLRPALGAGTGRLSGPALHAVAVASVWEVHQALPELPVVGAGGVSSGFDALELMLAGACAVQVGTATLHDPAAPARVLAELREELSARNITRAADAVGRAHRPEGDRP